MMVNSSPLLPTLGLSDEAVDLSWEDPGPGSDEAVYTSSDDPSFDGLEETDSLSSYHRRLFSPLLLPLLEAVVPLPIVPKS